MKDKLTNYIRAGYPGIFLVSPEEARVEAVLKAVADTLGYGLHAWSVTTGLIDTNDGSSRSAEEPLEAIRAIGDLPEKTLVVLRDFQAFLDDGNPVLVRALREELAVAKTRAKVIIILGCRQVLPPEMEREFTVVEFDLPGKDILGEVLANICESSGVPLPRDEAREAVLDAAMGLTTIEAENAFALSAVEARKICPDLVAREKAAAVKKNGLLEVVEVRETLDDIGGLDALKDWLVKRRDAFGPRAREYRLPSPKGCLILGIPGTGKSLTAKAVASVLGRPLLKLDAGSLFGSLVGQSEANLRQVIQTAEAIAPCVLMVDEIEKGFSGSRSSGSTDGGTSSRVLGSFISWMQDRRAPVFVVATANDVTQLPPEFLRKGRFDELWFVDLPGETERRAIWDIQIRKHGREPGQFDVQALARGSDGFTGAEIEQAFIDALYRAFSEKREPGTLDCSMALGDTVPLSRLMSEQITALRSWSKGRARLATLPETPAKGRRLVA